MCSVSFLLKTLIVRSTPLPTTNNSPLNSASDILTYYRENFLPVFAYATAMEANISIEMLNEIRNCFDHLARADSGSHSEDNLLKAKNHLDRACLDCVKISWVACKKDIDKLYDSFTANQYMLIEGGAFWREISALYELFRDKSKLARQGESENIHGAITNSMDLYFEAIEVAEALREKINNKLTDLQHVVSLTNKGSFWHNLKWAIVGAIIGVLLGYTFNHINLSSIQADNIINNPSISQDGHSTNKRDGR